MTDTTTTTPTIVSDYLAMWLEPDETIRRAHIERVFTEDGRHVDPNADARGHDGLAEMVTAVHAQFPGFGMRQTTAVDQHNDQLRFGWELLAADGSTILTGIDAGEVAADGRLSRITGFWGDLQPA